MKNIDIDIIKEKAKCEKIRWTNHVLIRLLKRKIKQSDVVYVILKE